MEFQEFEDHDAGNYTRQLMDCINSMDPFEREMLIESITDYNCGRADMMELLHTFESVLSSREDLMMGFHVMIHEYERDEADEYLQKIIENKRKAQLNGKNPMEDEGVIPVGNAEEPYVTAQEFMNKSAAMKNEIQDADEMLFLKIMQMKSCQHIINDDEDDPEPEEYDLVEDAFSFIMVAPTSFGAFAGIFTFCLQMSSYVLILLSLQTGSGQTYKEENLFSVPAGVSMPLTLSQGISIFFLIMVQDGLWGAAMIFLDGFDPNLRKEGIIRTAWYFGNSLRFIEGICMTAVTFFLIVRSSNVVTLFKEFTAMMFITSLDDTVFVLGEKGYLTKSIRDTADRVSNMTYFSTFAIDDDDDDDDDYRELIMDIIKGVLRLFLLLVILGLMFYLWAVYVVIPQQNGKYLEDILYIQIGDTTFPSLSRMSGFYEKNTKSMKDNRVTYVGESIKTEKNESVIIRYCLTVGGWVFTFENPKDSSKECENAFIKSMHLVDEVSFDLYVHQPDWLGKLNFEDKGRDIPMYEEVKIISVQKERIKEPPFSHVNPNITCTQIRLDERFPSFAGTKQWSDTYDILVDDETGEMLSVYQRPVFYSKDPLFDVSENWDVILFLGYRWALLSPNQRFKGMNNDTKLVKSYADLVAYIKRFDGYSSNYEVAFFSDPVKILSSNDLALPVLLKWYSATSLLILSNGGRRQTADKKREVGASFICSTCSNQPDAGTYNKCFFEGQCQSDNKCACSMESSGTLCQIPPKNDGRCNSYFNTLEFSYDGGDCCLSTCNSSLEYNCGLDSTGSYFVGYDLCNDQDGSVRQAIEKNKLKDYMNYTVSMVPNGRIIAVGNPRDRSVLIFDQDGSKWTQKRYAIKSSDALFGTKVKLLNPFNSVNTKTRLTPLTIAVTSQTKVHIYDWNATESNWRSVNLPTDFEDLSSFQQMQIYDEGRLLVLPEKDYLNVWTRQSFANNWSFLQKITGNIQIISMSETGKDLFLVSIQSSEYHIEHYNRRFNYLEKGSSFQVSDKILTLKASHDGNAFVLITKIVNEFVLWVYTKSRSNINTFIRREVAIRGSAITNTQTSVAISDDGLDVFVIHDTEQAILEFHWTGDHWAKKTNQMFGSVFSISRDLSSLVVANPPEQNEKVWYHMQKSSKCGQQTMIRITFNLNEINAEEIWWFVSKVTKSHDHMFFRKGYQKNIHTVITEEVCVPRDDCVYVSFMNPTTSNVSFGKSLVLIDGKPILQADVRKSTYLYSICVTNKENCRGLHDQLHNSNSEEIRTREKFSNCDLMSLKFNQTC